MVSFYPTFRRDGSPATGRVRPGDLPSIIIDSMMDLQTTPGARR